MLTQETQTETETEGFGCIASCVPSTLCGSCLSCATAPLLAHSVQARMVKRRSEDSFMVRQMTRRIFWQVVMSEMAHVNRLVLQNKQTRALPEWQQGSGSRSNNGLIADPLPHEQPRALPRRSPSAYAW